MLCISFLNMLMPQPSCFQSPLELFAWVLYKLGLVLIYVVHFVCFLDVIIPKRGEWFYGLGFNTNFKTKHTEMFLKPDARIRYITPRSYMSITCGQSKCIAIIQNNWYNTRITGRMLACMQYVCIYVVIVSDVSDYVFQWGSMWEHSVDDYFRLPSSRNKSFSESASRPPRPWTPGYAFFFAWCSWNICELANTDMISGARMGALVWISR